MKKSLFLSVLFFALAFSVMGQSEAKETTAQTAEKVTADRNVVTAKMNTKVITKREAEIKEASKKSECGSKKGKKSCCSSKKAKASSDVENAEASIEATAENGTEVASVEKKKSCCSTAKKCSGKKGKALEAKVVKQ